jgi:aspartyl protease family protein
MNQCRFVLALTALMLAAPAAWPATVFVMSVGRGDVQVVVDGARTYRLRAGDTTPEGVKLIEIRGGSAVLEVDGRPLAMGLGASTQAQTRIVADPRGHYVTTAHINGIPIESMIDTGASVVSLNRVAAQRLGISLSGGKRVVTNTANGAAWGTKVLLPRIQIGDILLQNVEADVTDGGPEQLGIVLIGMSFLRHVEMRQSGNTLTLQRPHY